MAGDNSVETNFISERRLELGPWPAFERAIARLIQHGGFNDVTVVGGSGDLGADVVATKGKKRWVIQAKYRANGQVGKDAVAEAFKAMQAYGTDVCVTATNQFFSKDAVKYNSSKRALGYEAQLWDRSNFVAWRQPPAHIKAQARAKTVPKRGHRGSFSSY